MSISHDNQPSMADVYRKLRGITEFTPQKRRRIENAFNSIWRYSGVALQDIPASAAGLREVLKAVEPAAHGVKRSTITSVRTLVMHGMKMSGLVPELARYRSHRQPLSHAWFVVFNRIPGEGQKAGLWSFVHFFNGCNVVPSQVSQQKYDEFVDYISATSVQSNLHSRMRLIARYWNALRSQNVDLNLQELTAPASRLRRLSHPMSAFPISLQNDLKRYRDWLVGEDVFADNARDRRVTEGTADGYLRKFHRVVSTLVDTGFPIEELTSLAVLVDLDVFTRIRHSLTAIDKSSQLSETFSALLLLVQIARIWLGLSPEHVSALENEKSKLRVPTMRMTEKNTKLVAQFDDPAATQRLFNAPALMWEQVKHNRKLDNRRRLAMAQGAIALGMLPYIPLRLGNLTDLTFGESILLQPRGTSSIIISAEASKSGRGIEFDIPAGLAELIVEYHDHIAPGILGRHPTSLFCRPDGDSKGFAQVRRLVQSYFKEYVGFHMNPHAFRHLGAKLILDSDPGAHTLVQELLGHRSVETSTAYCAGLSSRRAGRHHAKLIQQAMQHEAVTSVRSRRKMDWS